MPEGCATDWAAEGCQADLISFLPSTEQLYLFTVASGMDTHVLSTGCPRQGQSFGLTRSARIASAISATGSGSKSWAGGCWKSGNALYEASLEAPKKRTSTNWQPRFERLPRKMPKGREVGDFILSQASQLPIICLGPQHPHCQWNRRRRLRA